MGNKKRKSKGIFTEGLNEFEFIDAMSASFFKSSLVVIGSGDDTAVYKRDAHTYTLFATDALVEGVHFKKNEKMVNVGRKALAVNISDIAAMAGVPDMAVITVGVVKDRPLKDYKALYRGLSEVAEKFKVSLVGGDTVVSPTFFINVAITGIVSKKGLVLRSGAKVGDAICVTGTLGGSRGNKEFNFTPRMFEAVYLAEEFDLHAMIDISDGLAGDIGHIMKQSRVGADIFCHRIPVSTSIKGGSETARVKKALTDGEDFELLFTLPQSQVADVQKAFARKKGFPKVTQVGVVTRKKSGLRYLNQTNHPIKLDVHGYTQF